MILYITMNAQRNNVTGTKLMKPEKGSVKRLQDMLGETQKLICINIV